MAGDPLTHLRDDPRIDADKIIATHAGFACDTCRHDNDIGALDGGIAVVAADQGIESLDRARLCDIERLSLGHALDDIDEDDIAELFQPGKVGQCATDLAGPDEGQFPARHPISPMNDTGPDHTTPPTPTHTCLSVP